MDKDLLYRFFEGRASVEEMRLVKEWSEAFEENSKLLRRERKLFNAIILSGRFESSDGQTTLRKKRNHFVREFLKIASVVAITVGITAALFSIGEDKEDMNVAMQTITVPAARFTRWFKRLAERRNDDEISCLVHERQTRSDAGRRGLF